MWLEMDSVGYRVHLENKETRSDESFGAVFRLLRISQTYRTSKHHLAISYVARSEWQLSGIFICELAARKHWEELDVEYHMQAERNSSESCGAVA